MLGSLIAPVPHPENLPLSYKPLRPALSPRAGHFLSGLLTTLLSGLPFFTIRPLQLIQNAAARLIS